MILMEHNRKATWLRFWSALGAEIVAERIYISGLHAEIARDLARFEARRYADACYALGTTRAAYEAL